MTKPRLEPISVLDVFKIGVGPSSSHTLGPWRAARRFVETLQSIADLDQVTRLRVELYGSLGKTGRGHGTDLALMMGLEGQDPETCDVGRLPARVAEIRASHEIMLLGRHLIGFVPELDLLFVRDRALPYHPNAMTIWATFADGSEHSRTYYSVGGGFVEEEGQAKEGVPATGDRLEFATAAALLAACREQGLSIPELMLRNERYWREDDVTRTALAKIWRTMLECMRRGCETEGILPGPLGVVRRAARFHERLIGGVRPESLEEWIETIRSREGGFRQVMEWVSCFALAVNEENAAFGRVVTAPTNGAAGVVPAVLMYGACFEGTEGSGVGDFLLTAAAVAMLFQRGATISGALGGCQAEIGVSSAMAAAGLSQVCGATPEQVLMAAEIAMEHHLGLTCDPVAGLVQVPCIERNAMGALKAILACQLALEGDPAKAKIPLDMVIRTMWATAQDMSDKYKETSEGGLAAQIPVNVTEC